MSIRVLIAEDYDDARMMMKIMLEMSGYEVIEACNGREAVEKAAEGQPDVILMDIAMPVMNGVDATRAIRQMNPTIPIICVTAHVEFVTQNAIDAGCNEIVKKPVDFGTLEPAIQRYFSPAPAAISH